MKVWRDGDHVVLEDTEHDVELARLGWREANELGESILDIVQALVDELPDPPVTRMSEADFMAGKFREVKNNNVDVVKPDGSISLRCRGTLKPLIR